MKTIEVFDEIETEFADQLENNADAVKLRMTSLMNRLLMRILTSSIVTAIGIFTGGWLLVLNEKGWAILALALPAFLSIGWVIRTLQHMVSSRTFETSRVVAAGEEAFLLIDRGINPDVTLLRMAQDIRSLERAKPDHPNLAHMRIRCQTIHWILRKAGRISMTYESLFPKES